MSGENLSHQDLRNINDEYEKPADLQTMTGKDPVTGRFLPGNTFRKGKGTKTIASKQAVRKMEQMGVDPLEFLCTVIDDEKENIQNRIRAAERLLEYGYQKQPQRIENAHEGSLPALVLTTKEFKDGKDITDDKKD